MRYVSRILAETAVHGHLLHGDPSQGREGTGECCGYRLNTASRRISGHVMLSGPSETVLALVLTQVLLVSPSKHIKR